MISRVLQQVRTLHDLARDTHNITHTSLRIPYIGACAVHTHCTHAFIHTYAYTRAQHTLQVCAQRELRLIPNQHKLLDPPIEYRCVAEEKEGASGVAVLEEGSSQSAPAPHTTPATAPSDTVER